MEKVISQLFEIINQRKEQPAEGSYTCYLFEKGIDKILKKVGEESSEVIISAKNGDNAETSQEICDLLYHLLVLMAAQGISLEEVNAILEERAKKIGNLKQLKNTDHNT